MTTGESLEPSSWARLQEDIDSCTTCKRLGSGLIVYCEKTPARPPSPTAGSLLFISEAPPPGGGFWAPPPVRDDLREKLFSILREFLRGNDIQLPDPHARGSLVKFTLLGLFLIQTVKWPLCDSARTLRPAERLLIEHLVDSHVSTELAIIKPSAIIPLGKVACYACERMFSAHRFVFRPRKLEAVRGKTFHVAMNHSSDVPLYPTGLPLKQAQRRNELPRLAQEIHTALSNHWNPTRGSFVGPTDGSTASRPMTPGPRGEHP